MGYLHTEITAIQSSKTNEGPCGDIVFHSQDTRGTLFILADGMGTGIKANLNANLFIAWLCQYLKDGLSLRRSIFNLLPTLRRARSENVPFAALCAGRIEPDGTTHILCYETPPPIRISNGFAVVPQKHILKHARETLYEFNFRIAPSDALLIVSDGVTQAGMGGDKPLGWTVKGVCDEINRLMRLGEPHFTLARTIHNTAQKLSTTGHDDTSVLMIHGRKSRIVNILTGPPADTGLDAEVVQSFMLMPGKKVVCGGTTSEIVAREICEDIEVELEQHVTSSITPPGATIDSVDLVTEGSVSLNQLYNIWDIDPDLLEPESPVTKLYQMLKDADRVQIIAGKASNPATSDISFRQRGILKRCQILPLLADKLRSDKKIVSIKYT